MSRIDDTMDDTQYYELIRKVDKLNNIQETTDKTISNIIERQEKHETKFEAVVENLAASVAGIDKKLEVFVARLSGSSTTWDKLTAIGPTIVIAIVSGFWAYNQHLENKIVADKPPVTISTPQQR